MPNIDTLKITQDNDFYYYKKVENSRVMDAIENSGFVSNDGINLRYLSDGFHANHPQYTKVVEQKLTDIMEKNGGTISAGDVQGVINQMHNFINNAEKAFDGTKATNLNNFSRDFVK